MYIKQFIKCSDEMITFNQITYVHSTMFNFIHYITIDNYYYTETFDFTYVLSLNQ